jgi:hypothetical protein
MAKTIKPIALITIMSIATFPVKLAAARQPEKNLIKLEILVKNLRTRQKRLASEVAGQTERLL